MQTYHKHSITKEELRPTAEKLRAEKKAAA